MAPLDYAALRAQTMGSGNDEEAVTVNTRALIDKVLARYSSEWTTLRELLQNAADAQATTVTIKFETLPSVEIAAPNTTNQSETLKHVLMNHKLRRLVVTNDGQPFGKNDWSRLKRIAEGNPDETKIGAFGVGFYSVFADCEDPFVSSGNEAMAFYWKGNSLFTRTLQLPEGEGNKNTSFVLDYRNNTSAVPNLISLCQFLGTSLTFVALQKIDLQLDDWTIITLQKKVAPGVNVPISRDVETKTKDGIMKVQSLERESVQMDATFMNVVGWRPAKATGKPTSVGDSTYGGNVEVSSLRSFFSRLSSSKSAAVKTPSEDVEVMQDIPLEDLTETTTSNVFLRVTTASIKTYISSNFAAELERATKKPPPKFTKLAILTSSYDEVAVGSQSKSIDVFSSVLPNKKPGGRVFIGFPTHQTTGASLHLSAPSVIPTVERESIDLNARWVRSWNVEMLRCAGIASRLAYVSEMAEFTAKIQRETEAAGTGKKITKEIIQKFLPEAIHILQTYTFDESTPSQQVSTIIEEAFWTTYKSGLIEVYSSRGVLLNSKVRLATEDLSGFVEGIPVVPEELTKKSFVRKLVEFGLITNIRVDDVRREIEAKALDKTQLTHFLSWIGKNAVNGYIDSPIIHSLLDVAVATLGEGESQGTVLALGTITHYLNDSKIPANVPIPSTTLPFEFSRSTSSQELQALGWEPLEIVPWLRFLIDSSGSRGLPVDQNITLSPTFAAQVLLIISKQWDGLSQSSKATVVTLLKSKTVIPTKMGMKFPEDAYFQKVKLFDDLPTISSCPGVKEKFFAALGVRKTVDLEVIFTRLLNPAVPKDGEKTTKWNHVDLIKYLVSVREDIPAKDLVRLKETPLCPAATTADEKESSNSSQKLYKISELFEPRESLQKLGFPILQWPGATDSWRAGSPEGKFLSMLGLRPYPTPQELVEIMAGNDAELRRAAMIYYVTQHAINGYAQFSIAGSTKKFLPIEGDDRLVSPAECFTNMKATVLGFPILNERLHAHANIFGVRANPNINTCVDRLLLKPPQTHRDAIALFSYFAGRLQDVSSELIQNKLANAKFIPITSRSESEKITKTLRHVTPTSCYLGNSEQFKDIFDFVDFGPEANTFLLKCGSKHEPSRNEVAHQMCREPAKLLGIVQSPEKYLDLLTFLALGLNDLKKDKVLFQKLKTAPFLLASQEIPSKPGKDQKSRAISSSESYVEEEEEDDDVPVVRHFSLAAAKDVVIMDDITSFNIFRESLLCCPQDDGLEKFYAALDVPLLSTLIKDDNKVGSALEKQDDARVLRQRILERSAIFLHGERREDIKHDVRWLEKHMEVKMVSSISMRRYLTKLGLSSVEKRSAARSGSSKEAIIYVVPKYDYYQLSAVLVSLLLSRTQRHSAMMLESILSRPLLELRARGYNVDRILRAKAVEQRIAEQQRKVQLEEEQKQIKEQEAQWKNNQATPASRDSSRRHSGQVAMPGAFGSDSPENSPVVNRQPRGLFSGITKRLGLDTGEASKQLQNLLGNNQTGSQQEQHKGIEAPPPYNPPNPGAPQTSPGQPESVTAPHQLHQNLVNAIGASRAHDSSTLFSAPRTNTVKEQSTYCDTAQGHDIAYLASTTNGIRIFNSKDLSIPATEFLAKNVAALNAFAAILFDVCDIYGIDRMAMHIFVDEKGPTIAFNRAGSVFCNYRYFDQLHARQMSDPQGRVEATSWWWVVVAHELAHNLVPDHSAAHSYYTESFVQQYFPRMMSRAATLVQNTAQAQKQPEQLSQSLLD